MGSNGRWRVHGYRAVLALAFAATPALAQPSVWKDAHGEAVPDATDRKSVNDFGGMLLLTPDPDWEAKWNTSPEQAPQFTTSDVVSLGQRLTLLILFVHPQADASGVARVTCDIAVTRADGTSSLREEALDCFHGRIEGDSYNLRLSEPVLAFVGEAGDPKGTWRVHVVLHDTVKGVEIPLDTQFEMQ